MVRLIPAAFSCHSTGYALPLGAAPGVARRQANRVGGEHPAAAIPLNQNTVAVFGLVFGISAARLGAQAKQHQLAAIVQLERKPVPARLPLGQYRAAPLVIKPALSGDGAGLAIASQGAAKSAGAGRSSKRRRCPGSSRCNRPCLAAPAAWRQ